MFPLQFGFLWLYSLLLTEARSIPSGLQSQKVRFGVTPTIAAEEQLEWKGLWSLLSSELPHLLIIKSVVIILTSNVTFSYLQQTLLEEGF